MKLYSELFLLNFKILHARFMKEIRFFGIITSEQGRGTGKCLLVWPLASAV